MADQRNQQLVRILMILRDLDRQGGADLYELAERYGMDARTVRRDLQALQEAGLPLDEEQSDGPRKRWRIAFSDKLSQVSALLDVSHYLALRLAMDSAAHGKTSAFTALEDLADKVEQSLGKKDHARLREIVSSVHSLEKFAYQQTPPDVLWPLIDAISGRKLCKVRYRAISHGEGEKTYKLLPLKMFAYERAIYLHAYIAKHDAVIVLNLQRLVSMQVLGETGTPPRGYDADALADSAFGVFVGKTTAQYRLHFSATTARRISERVWHPTQQLRELRDGSVELTLTCYASPEIVGWIRSFGSDVEVLEPQALRTELALLGRSLADRYGTRA